ncbi:MAG TPA: globin domain-containing protein, partial [Burkholderiaceae bacterium]|nr:globin domain-containing protein [Burkholderiaceae bacterium]
MTPAQIELVQASFTRLADRADAVAGAFYDRLFALDPTLRPLFAADLRAQRAKLMTMLATALQGLHDLPSLLPAARALGARHARYGVRDEHHAIVGRALLDTLRDGLGRAFTP